LYQLEYLSLEYASITDIGLSQLRNLAELKELDLTCCSSITDQGLSNLHAMKKLEVLDLRGCEKLTTSGVESLRSALPHCIALH
jgi:hypothetical protein